MEHTLNYVNPPKYSEYKRKAKANDREFELTKEQFDRLSTGNCYYCNVEGPNGIDRIDNSKGYSIENCVSCCKHCNYVKGNLSIKLFNEWKKRFIEHQKSEEDK
ncbi:hypothetical protein [Spirochaeta lutea]|uniref:hypothetical protein n=1 Tax=Spirochaeta lutea TaxID=1480694 RepID=UPI0005691854|nr:hypothetical protein [Spirochaeta lutea]